MRIWKGPVGRITAIDLNTGEHLWVIPHGDAPEQQQRTIREHPLLRGVPDVMTNPGRTGHSAMVVTPTLLFMTGQTSEGTPRLFGVDRKTGARLGQVATPKRGQYGLMTFMHEGRQYIVMPVDGGYTALTLPDDATGR